ncbi:MAG: membrane protein insertase YidC, partial [Rubrivivax sp.]|nr:membrane protein insertase YidC [Rubrivivax sp.]
MDNQRLILFIVFSFTLLLLWEAWQDQNAPVPETPTTASAPATEAPTPTQALNAPPATVAAPTSGFAKGHRAVVETDVLRASIDANGGDLRELQLLTYRETEDKNQILTLFEDSATRPYL